MKEKVYEYTEGGHADVWCYRTGCKGQDEMEADDSLWYSNKPCLCEQMMHFENWPKVWSSIQKCTSLASVLIVDREKENQ